MYRESFTKAERELRGEYWTKLNAAESTEDVRKFFVQTVGKLFSVVFEGEIPVAYEDISLDEGCEGGYRLGRRLAEEGLLRETLATSDLSSILGRLAAQACNRMKHLEKNPAKTEAKIYHDR